MNKDTSITIRLKNELKEQFENAVKAQFVKAVQNNEDYEHITTSEVLRSFIKAYCGGRI